MSETTRVCGAIGASGLSAQSRARVARMAEGAGLSAPDAAVDEDGVLVFATSAMVPRPDPTGRAWMFNTAGAPSPTVSSTALNWPQAARDADVAGLVCADEGTVTLHSSISGVQPLYVEFAGETVFFATALNLLLDSAEAALRPDWSGWAHIIGLGAPLGGRTTVEGVRRLGPMAHLSCTAGQRPQLSTHRWEWEQILPEEGLHPGRLTSEVIEALREQVAGIRQGPAQPMLSGGRDSRMLAGLAQQASDEGAGPLTAWTTSSDTGTTLEELTAARIAAELGLQQRIVAGRHDQFGQDFLDYARVTGFQASFHVWLMPVARELARQRGTILDGLGGGVFLGGGFPDDPDLLAQDPSPAQLLQARFSRLSRYLQVGEELLAPGVGRALTERSREDFDAVAAPLAKHPNGATLTAYLTRTLPGISMAPAAVLGGSLPTAVPIMSDAVVSHALRVSPAAKRDGAWYSDLMRTVRPQFAEIPTAADLTTVRQHGRRGASFEAARWYRELIIGSPVAELLGEELHTGGIEVWQQQLGRTRPQHLIRGLALLALWLQEYGADMSHADLSPLRGR